MEEALNSERFVDQSPRAVYADLLDEEKYLCSWRTMYRIMSRSMQVRERRNQRRHPHTAGGDPAESTVELGHHQTNGPVQRGLLSALRDH